MQRCCCRLHGLRCWRSLHCSCCWNGGPTTGGSPYEHLSGSRCMTSLSFTALCPLALLLGLPLIWWLRRRSATNLSPGHLNVATALRTLSFALLVLALTGPVWL